MATTPVLLPRGVRLMESHGKSHGWRSLVGCSLWGCKESDTTERLHFHFSLSCIGGGNGNPLPRSCLENPRDGEAWWAAVYGVAQSRARLKRLSSSSSSMHTIFIMLCNTVLPSQVALVVKNRPANAGDSRDASSIPELGRTPGGVGNGKPY